MFTYATKLFFTMDSLSLQNRAPDLLPDQPTESPPGEELNITSSNVTAAPPITTRLSDVEYIGYLYVMPVICFIGIILNSLTIFILKRSVFRSATYIFLCTLSAADIITAVFTLPGGLSLCYDCPGLVRGYHWLVYEVYVFVPFTNISECVSAWTTLVLAAERLMAVRHPYLDKSQVTGQRRAYCIMIITATGSVLLNLPYFFPLSVSTSVRTMLTGFGRSIGFQVFSWIRAILVQFLPLVVLIVLNVLLIREVHLSRQRCSKMSLTSKSSMREKAQTRLTLMLVGTVVMFITGHIPVALAYTVIFKAIFGHDSLGSSFYSSWRVITHCISLLSYALDFVVYCAVNKYFRKACADLLLCERMKKKVSDVTTASSNMKKPVLFYIQN